MAEQPCAITLLTADDGAVFGEIAALHLASRAAAMPWLPVLHDLADTQAFFASQHGRWQYWLARDATGRLMGFSAGADGWLEQLYLAPACRGQGIGSKLLQPFLGELPLQLWCFTDNAPARRFYERHGFVAEHFTDGLGNEERCPDVRYRYPGTQSP